MAEKKNTDEQQPQRIDDGTEIEPLSDESLEEVAGGGCSVSNCTFVSDA